MSDSLLPSRVSGYHDFGGLAGLRGDAAQGASGALRETAKQFEAHFIQNMLKTMRESVERSDLTESREADMFQDLMDKEVATKMAERGSLGLADMLVRNMAERAEPTAHEALGEREKAWPPRAQPLSLKGDSGGLPLPENHKGGLPLKARALVKGIGDE